MNRPRLSPAATRLLRVILDRAGDERGRILLSIFASTDWQSLTLTGERHQFELRVPGGDSKIVVERMCNGLEDAEFSIPGLIVADIAVVGEPVRAIDGSTSVTIEALTIEE